DIGTSSAGIDQPEKPPLVIPTPVIDKPVGRLVYNRVKVKIKTSKLLEPQITSSDAHTQSDTDKSSQHIGSDKQVVSEKVEDSANSVPPESKVVASTTQPKRTGIIKIKSSKGFSSSLSPCNSSGVPQAEGTHQKEPETVSRESLHNNQERTHQKEPETVSRDSLHNNQKQTHQKEPETVSRDSPHNNQERTHQNEPETVSRDLLHTNQERTHQKEPATVSFHNNQERTYQKEPELVSRDFVDNKQEQTHLKETDSIPRDPVYTKQEQTHQLERNSVSQSPVYNMQEQTHQKEPESVSRDSLYNKQEQTHQKEPESVSRESVYNKKELNASLEVIKKIMKMDAAEPFNVPVNPVALGIPDYFDVIKTPMDFGTICNNLENGLKYKNSEDVYKDVEYIWGNCYKYNSKGDYILELMKRVKKNFSKCWSAAGLYSDQGEDGSSHGKSSSKGGHSKHKSKKRHGQEREQTMQSSDDQIRTSDGRLHDVKTVGTSTAGSPNGDDTSSSSDNSQNQDADTEQEDRGEAKFEKELQNMLQSKQQYGKAKQTPTVTHKENAIDEQSQLDGSRSGTEKNGDIQMAEAGDATNDDANNEEKMMQHEDETAAVEHPKPK
ncbi:ankyrin repeat, bromo and BTB domain-containing protein, partial [Tanacetum coccineum]